MDKKFFITIPSEILANKRLGFPAKVLAGYLDFRQGQNDRCWQKEDTIASELATTRATIQRATKQLEAEGELIVERRHGGLKQSNRYWLAHRYNARDSQPYENGASKRSTGGASNQGAKSQSGASNRSTKIKITKIHRGKRKANSFDDSFYKNAEEKNRTILLVSIHTQKCPAILNRGTKPENQEDIIRPLYGKVRDALREYGYDRVLAAIEYFSPKSDQGDGWGLVIQSLRKGWTESRLREAAFDEKAKRDQQECSKQPAQGKSQPVRLFDEKKTQQERDRQIRELREAK